MVEDLASVISRASLATLELADYDQGLDDLSREALRGGANRFTPVIANETVRYVAPVRVPDRVPSVGALVIQESRIGLVWRVGKDGPTQTWWAPLEGTTQVVCRPEWTMETGSGTRFEVTHDGHTSSFLLPSCRGPVHSVFARLMGARTDESGDGMRPRPATPVATPAPVEDAVLPPSAFRRPVGSPTSASESPPPPTAVRRPVGGDTGAIPTLDANEATRVAAHPAVPAEPTVTIPRQEPAAETPHRQRPSVTVQRPEPTPVSAPQPRASGALPGFLVGFLVVLAIGLVAMFLL